MKIVLLHYSAPPIVGGVENVLTQHARLMMEAGHSVSVAAGRGKQTNPRIPFIRLPLADSQHPEILASKKELDAGHLPQDFPRLVDRVYRELKKATAGADLLIAHNVCSLNKNLPLTAAVKRLSEAGSQPRIMLWHHDLAWKIPAYQSQLHDGYPWDLIRKDWPGVTQVTISDMRQMEMCELMGFQPARVHVVPNGIEADTFLKLEPETVELVHKLDLLKAVPLLLLPVRILPRKNIEMALHILAALKRTYPRASLIVTGPPGPHDPANLDYFQELITLRSELGLEGSAHFLVEMVEGLIPDTQISDLYSLADMLLLPSRNEGFGLPVLEAGLKGIPVFCSDLPPMRQVGGEDANYFNPDDDPDQVAQSISNLLNIWQVYHLKARVRSEFTWEGVYSRSIAPLLEGG